MKKSLYTSIILGVAILGLGTQITSLTTVRAAEEVNESQSQKVVSEAKGNAEVSDVNVVSTPVESSEEKSDDTESQEEPQATESQEEPQATESQEEPQATETIETTKINEKDVSIDEERFDDKASKEKQEKISDVNVYGQAKDDSGNTSQPRTETKIIKVRPLNIKLANIDDPSDKGDLLVPYKIRGNSAVYVLDENNNPIEDSSNETGYKMRFSGDVYKDDNLHNISDPYMGEIYSAGGDLEKAPQTSKVKKLLSLVKEAKFFMEFRNYGYSNAAELTQYINDYHDVYARLNALGDDGNPISKPVKESVNDSVNIVTPIKSNTTTKSNRHNSYKTVINNLTITTIRRAQLFTEDGKLVNDRCLENNSTWQADKILTINGQKMYRITPTEWVKASDVQ
ncbi:hypothetical protein [Companilactobacillus kimchiensis]|nr:hypothetical protein [Companilactobacillus kimchiensis]